MELRKNKKYDLERKRSLFFGFGLIIALVLTISAFEWRTEIDPIIGPDPTFDPWEGEEPIEVTAHKKLEPPKPKPIKKPIEVVETTNELEKASKEIELDLDPFRDETDEQVDTFTPISSEEVTDEPFLVVESMPIFPGGEAGLYAYFAKNLNYPRNAKRMGVEGTVTIQFVIEKDGSISNVEVLKGIGFGCDDEAERVIKSLPDFVPGKQRGQPVRVQMAVPIHFRLK